MGRMESRQKALRDEVEPFLLELRGDHTTRRKVHGKSSEESMSPNWLGSDGREWNIRKNASERDGWMVRGGQVEEGAGRSSGEKMKKYLGTTRKYLEVIKSIWKYSEVLGSAWTE